MGGSSSRKTTEDQQGTTNTRLPFAQQSNVDLIMSGAKDYYNSGGPKYYPGQVSAGPTPNELAARDAATSYATGAGQTYADQAVAGNQFWMDPSNVFNPQNIPGFRASEGYVKDELTRNLTENILPNVRSGSVAQGALGGSRQGISEGLGIDYTQNAVGKALSGMEMDAYSQGLGMQDAALGRAGDIYGVGLAPAETLNQVGGAERTDAQQVIDDLISKFNFEQLAPLLNLEALKELTGTAGQYGGSTDFKTHGTSSTKEKADPTGAIVQAVGSIIAAYAMSGSHSSLKKDIEPANGILEKLQKLQIYKWTYKEQEIPHIGPMAEDFRSIFGVGDGITINAFDVLGVLLGAVKELSIEKEGV